MRYLLALCVLICGVTVVTCDDTTNLPSDGDADSDGDGDGDGDGDSDGDGDGDSDGGPCEAIGVLEREDFDATLDSFAIRGGRWSVVDGWVELENPAVDEPVGNLLLHGAAVYSEAVVRVRAEVPAETDWDDFVVVFGYKDASTFHFVSVNEQNGENTSGVFRARSGEALELVDITTLMTPGVPIDVEVIVDGQHFSVALDGSVVAEGDDEELVGGRTGLGTYNNSARFDVFEIGLEGCDSEAPTPPSDFNGEATRASAVLRWSEARDDTAVVGYTISRDGVQLSGMPITALSFEDTTVAEGATYAYTVVAHDAAGRTSPESTPVDVTIPEIDPATIILHVDFDTTPTGPYAGDALEADWPGLRWQSAERCDIIDGADAYSGRSLRVLYPEGGVGPGEGGAQWRVDLPELYEELFVSYVVRFEPGFQWVRGGKLPGLLGGEGNTGGNVPDGTDGWSGRMMWQSDGGIIQYIYHPDQPGTWGDGVRWDLGYDRIVTPDEWVLFEHRFVINTPGEHDGSFQGWWNGELAAERTELRFRDVDTFAIDGFYFSTFFGGSGPEYAPLRDEYIYFDEFIISTGPITH